MEKVTVFHDKSGRTLTVWFASPDREHVCQEIADDVILMKDAQGQVIGFEQLNYRDDRTASHAGGVSVEVQSE